MRVLVQMRSSAPIHAAALAFAADTKLTAPLDEAIPGLTLDASFPPVQVPGVEATTGTILHSLAQPLAFSFEPTDSTYVVRGHIPDDATQAATINNILKHPDVKGVFSDPRIESCITCGPAPVGTATDVASLLGVKKLAAANLTGKGIYLAIVDTGINLAHLKKLGVTPKLDVANSFVPSGVATTPGQHPLDHGTMCAYDALIAAPEATLLDHAVLLSNTPGANAMAGLLSDAVLAYQKLRTVLTSLPEAKRAMVVSNSWGMFSQSDDFPPGHAGNYSDNPNHPFNIIVGSLESAGADILFAAGNCGKECPDKRCGFGTAPSICGANSHPSVLSVAGVDIHQDRVGYSSRGPGRLTKKKPDIACYTQFKGSQVYAADGGTSAACPVAAGVVAAIRTQYSAKVLPPLQLRTLICRNAIDRGGVGYDFEYGYGIVDPTFVLTNPPGIKLPATAKIVKKKASAKKK